MNEVTRISACATSIHCRLSAYLAIAASLRWIIVVAREGDDDHGSGEDEVHDHRVL
jgi:hypothetical protein